MNKLNWKTVNVKYGNKNVEISKWTSGMKREILSTYLNDWENGVQKRGNEMIVGSNKIESFRIELQFERN